MKVLRPLRSADSIMVLVVAVLLLSVNVTLPPTYRKSEIAKLTLAPTEYSTVTSFVAVVVFCTV